MNKQLLITIVLGVLVLLSAVQAFQLNGMQDQLAEEGVTVAAGKAPAPSSHSSSAASTSTATSLDSLPSMVGGC